MKKPVDERVKMPEKWMHVLISVGCISFLAFIFKDDSQKDFTLSIVLLFSGIVGGLTVWSTVLAIGHIYDSIVEKIKSIQKQLAQ